MIFIYLLKWDILKFIIQFIYVLKCSYIYILIKKFCWLTWNENMRQTLKLLLIYTTSSILLHQRETIGSTIQYGNRKWGTHGRVFSQTPAHGNSMQEWNETDEDGKKRDVWKKVQLARKKEVPSVYHYLIKIQY